MFHSSVNNKVNVYITTYSYNKNQHSLNIILFIVPSEPCSLRKATVTSTTVTVKWMPPDTPNGLITHYSVQYGGRVIDYFGSNTLNGLGGTIEGLSPDTEYVLQLRAHTRVGPGPPASLNVKTGKLLILQYSKLPSHLAYCTVHSNKKGLGHKAKYFCKYVAIGHTEKLLSHPPV